jgi:ABC-type transport system involved in cytochrome bd biosynthesis fused ATPase/permease subunit
MDPNGQQAGTIRQNILCERPFQAQLFQTAIECCALQLDIQRMPNAENYRISGEGITLSGGKINSKININGITFQLSLGQKVRLALARALYADKQVYLLDDPFAALDRTVAHFVYENYVEKGLRAREKLVILCTHHEEFLLNADLVIRLDADGKVEKIGWENTGE